MVNQAHLNKWLHALRTTDKPQAQQQLAGRVESHGGDLGYCCLGIGCVVMGLEPTYEKLNEYDFNYVEGEPDDFTRVTFEGEPTIAPSTFGAWLGIEEYDEPGIDPELSIPWEYDRRTSKHREMVTCAGLNDDWRLTFSQIADMIAYFGLRDSV